MKLHELEKLWNLPPGELERMMRPIVGENASPEELEAAVMEIMSGVEKMLERPYSLQECLSFLSKEDLIEIAKTLKLKGYSKLRREELQQLLQETLTDAHFMNRMYPSLTNGEVEVLKQMCIVNTPMISTDMMFYAAELIRHGLCYLDEQGKHLVIPEELKQTFTAAQADASLKAEQKKNSAFYDVCNAAVYFCGVYPVTGLCEQLQKQFRYTASEEDFIRWHTEAPMYREEFFFKNGYIVSAALRETPEDIVALQQIQKMKKRIYWPTKKELEFLSMEQWLIKDALYEPFWDFSSVLMENEFGDVMSVSRFVEASIRTGAPFDALIGFLSEQIFAFESMEEIDAFAQVIQNIWNHTPMWENCGYSPNQMKALLAQKGNTQKTSAKSNVISLAERRAKKNQ